MTVSPHRPTRLLLALALLVGVQGSYVNPGVVAAELRALSCCAHDCDRPVPLPEARRCCGVTAMASGPAETPIAPAADTVAPILFTARCPVTAVQAPRRPAADAVRVGDTGPPTFLEQRHLLL